MDNSDLNRWKTLINEHIERRRVDEEYSEEFVNSSNIDSIGYDDEDQVMDITFHSGSVYRYFDVEQEMYDDILVAVSKGKFFWNFIRDSYRYRKIA